MSKSKKNIGVVMIIILLILALVVAGAIIYINLNSQEEPVNSEGVVGRISDGWDTGLEEEEQDSSVSGGTQIPGYGTAEMNYGDDSLYLSIGNPKANQCGFYATLKLEDGTVLYKSELLEPGYGLTEVPISVKLEKGEYTAMVEYQCVVLNEEHTPLNTAESEFTLIVK